MTLTPYEHNALLRYVDNQWRRRGMPWNMNTADKLRAARNSLADKGLVRNSLNGWVITKAGEAALNLLKPDP